MSPLSQTHVLKNTRIVHTTSHACAHTHPHMHTAGYTYSWELNSHLPLSPTKLFALFSCTVKDTDLPSMNTHMLRHTKRQPQNCSIVDSPSARFIHAHTGWQSQMALKAEECPLLQHWDQGRFTRSWSPHSSVSLLAETYSEVEGGRYHAADGEVIKPQAQARGGGSARQGWRRRCEDLGDGQE